ncbi:MAG: AMIN domain-containing protein [Microcoleaceae cyanobacterium]
MPNPSQKKLSQLTFLLKFIGLFVGLVGTLAINFGLTRPVFAAFLTNWFFDPDNNQLQFTLPTGTTPSYSVESQPPRLVVYIPETEVSVNVTELYPAGLVRRVSLYQEQPQQAKVTIDLAPEVVLSTQQVQLQQIGSENSWQLRLFVDEGEIIDEEERSNQALAGATATETMEVEESESSPDDTDNQAVTQTKPNSAGFLETNPKQESVLLNPPPSPEPSVPLLVIPTDRPSQFRSPVIDALSNKQPTTEPSQIREAPTLQTTQTQESFIPAPPEASSTELPDVIPSQTIEQPTLQAKENQENIVPPPPESKSTTSVNVIPFGEPLPGLPGENQSKVMEDNSAILIEEGEVINLIYPSDDVELPRDLEQQEVLLLQKAIADQSGRIIVPAKTPVVGGFDTNSHGSKFTARAIYINGRFIPFAAKSELLRGHPHINKKVLAGSSAGGGLGLLLLTGSGFGFLAGAAIGAGTVVATSPRSVTVETNDIVEIRIVEDLPRSRFY